MATIDVLDVNGEVVEQRELPAELFDAAVNASVMHQVVVAGMAAQRAGTHSTKTRAEARGGGRKPWRQKGTGRARHGSIRSPIWSGGGISHGPKPRGYAQKVNKKVKRAALRSALTDAARGGRLALVRGLAFEGPRTRDAAALLGALGLEGKVLVVIAAPEETVEKSFRNLPHVKVDYPGNLSTYDLLAADRVLFTTEAFDALSGRTDEENVERPDEPPAAEPGEPSEEPDAGTEKSGAETEVEP
jgi:large subunit ribosomal protein L4